MIESAYRILYISVLVCLAVAIIAQLIRSITGKLTIDRFIGVNMITTTTVLAMGVLTMLLGESYLPDIMIVYVVLSFLALMILCRLYINLHGKKGGPKQ
jgi:multicomponent Na+:H+ antiporter subunit F